MASDQQVVYSFLKFLKDHGNQDEVEVVTQCLSESFNVDLDNNEHKQKYNVPFGLKEIFQAGLEQLYNQDPEAKQKQELEEKFNEFLELLKQRGYFSGSEEGTPEWETKYQKAREKFMSRSGNMSEESRKQQAEQFKNQGNDMMKQKKFGAAIDSYTKAINLYDKNHVFFANRAAAHSYMKNYDSAIEDCNRAIELAPDYSKAYSRLGTAYFYKGMYQEAVEKGYRKAVELDPSNASYQSDLETVEKKIQQQQQQGAASQMPNPFAGAGGAGAGAGGLDQVFQNPAFLNMAQQMMQRPEMRDMVNNFASNMMGGQEGSSGGMPDISQMFGSMAGAAQGGAGDAQGGAPGGAGGAPGGFPGLPDIDPSMLQSIRDDPEFKDNPKIQAIMEEMRNEGPLALMKYLGDPDVMELVNKITTRAFNSSGSGDNGDKPNEDGNTEDN